MKVPPTEDEENTIPLLYVAVPLKVGVEDVFELLSIHVVTVAPVAGGVPVPAGSAPSSQRRHPAMLVGTNEVGRPIFVIGIYLVNDDVFIIIYLILTCRIYTTKIFAWTPTWVALEPMAGTTVICAPEVPFVIPDFPANPFQNTFEAATAPVP
jgi:hypothetical protein